MAAEADHPLFGRSCHRSHTAARRRYQKLTVYFLTGNQTVDGLRNRQQLLIGTVGSNISCRHRGLNAVKPLAEPSFGPHSFTLPELPFAPVVSALPDAVDEVIADRTAAAVEAVGPAGEKAGAVIADLADATRQSARSCRW